MTAVEPSIMFFSIMHDILLHCITTKSTSKSISFIHKPSEYCSLGVLLSNLAIGENITLLIIWDKAAKNLPNWIDELSKIIHTNLQDLIPTLAA